MKSEKWVHGDRMSLARRKLIDEAIIIVVRDHPGISHSGIEREVRKARPGYGRTSIGIAIERLIQSHKIERNDTTVPNRGFEYQLVAEAAEGVA